jgi:hypothetical protein
MGGRMGDVCVQKLRKRSSSAWMNGGCRDDRVIVGIKEERNGTFDVCGFVIVEKMH